MKKTLKNILAVILSVIDSIILRPYTLNDTQPYQKASIKFSALMTGIKGKIGGTVFQSSKIGFIAKNKPSGNYVKAFRWVLGAPQSTVNWNNSQQSVLELDPGYCAPDGTMDPYAFNNSQQQLIRQLSKAWQALEGSDRAAWNSAAPSFPFTNKWGETYTGSGYQVFMSINNALMQYGLAMQTLPPSPSDGTLPDHTWNTIFINSDPSATDFMQLQIPDGIASGAIVWVKASPAQSAGKLKTVFGGKGQCIVSEEDPSTVELLPQYNSLFGSLPIGSAVQFEIKVINIANAHIIYSATTQMIVPEFAATAKLKTVFGGKYNAEPAPIVIKLLNWLTGNQDYDIGNVTVDHDSDEFDILLYLIQLQANETVTLTLGGANPGNFFVGYDTGSIPQPGAITTQANGSGILLPKPLRVTFTPDNPGVFTATVTVSAPSLAAPIIIALQGTGV